MFPNSEGITPVKEFSWTSSTVKFCSRAKSDGIVPVRAFDPKSIYSNEVILPREEGMVPDKKLLSKSIVIKDFKASKSSGIVEDIKHSAMCTFSRFLRPVKDEILKVAFKLLKLKSTVFRDVETNGLGKSSPSILFRETLSISSFGKPPKYSSGISSNALVLNCSSLSLESFVMAGGRTERRFSDNDKISIFLSCDIFVGSVPVKKFLSNRSEVSFAIPPIASGMVPTNWFVERSNIFKDVIWPRPSGRKKSSPKVFPPRLSLSNTVVLNRSVLGRDPVK
mmetsp:Transcript_5959/g.16967  ORF Transcript_5959/g.16967 Transcript_5959/m.16967 type:complete len:280 (+) Transcript_5959:153-992(+)